MSDITHYNARLKAAFDELVACDAVRNKNFSPPALQQMASILNKTVPQNDDEAYYRRMMGGVIYQIERLRATVSKDVSLLRKIHDHPTSHALYLYDSLETEANKNGYDRYGNKFLVLTTSSEFICRVLQLGNKLFIKFNGSSFDVKYDIGGGSVHGSTSTASPSGRGSYGGRYPQRGRGRGRGAYSRPPRDNYYNELPVEEDGEQVGAAAGTAMRGRRRKIMNAAAAAAKEEEGTDSEEDQPRLVTADEEDESDAIIGDKSLNPDNGPIGKWGDDE